MITKNIQVTDVVPGDIIPSCAGFGTWVIIGIKHFGMVVRVYYCDTERGNITPITYAKEGRVSIIDLNGVK